jgi:putative transposase
MPLCYGHLVPGTDGLFLDISTQLIKFDMGRLKRIEYEGAIYHIISKGGNEGGIFKSDDDHKYFLNLACNSFIKNQVMLLSFALMKNHYHLLMKTEKANLSQVMHEINSKYAHRFNALYMRRGHLFNNRYKSYLIKDDNYFVNALIYINLNPVEASLVKKPEDYEWCSFKYFKDKTGAPECLNFQEISNLAGIAIEKISEFIKLNAPKIEEYEKEINENNDEKEIKKIKSIIRKIKNKYGDLINKTELKQLIIYYLSLKNYRLKNLADALAIPYRTVINSKIKAEKKTLRDSTFNEWLDKISESF